MNPGDEIVDIVDEEDRVVLQTTRREMRAGQLRHRAVYVLVFNARDELFVHKRTPTKDVYPSYYDVTAGGVLGAGERYDEGARRELAEELGIHPPLRLLFPIRFNGVGIAVNGMVYGCTSEGPFVLQPSEVESGEFLSLTDALELARHHLVCPDSLEVLRRYAGKRTED